MGKMRFLIVGSGWRSLYYVRVAKALSERFELCAMLCRTKEKAEKIAEEHGIKTSISIEECKEMKPDFVVVAVNKASIFEVSKEWLGYGFTVLCETPAALTVKELEEIWKLHETGGKLMVAEQYIHYPRYNAILKVLEKNLIGKPYNINISLAHEYHGASLMRAFLGEDVKTPFSLSAKSYDFPTALTLNRYERFTDGRIENKTRTIATFEFSDGKIAWYDFNSEQYRSPIRKNFLKIEGEKGQLKDNEIYFLAEDFTLRTAELFPNENTIFTKDPNPNLSKVKEVENIFLNVYKIDDYGKKTPVSGEKVYEAYFGKRGLSEDETAVAKLMKDAYEYSTGKTEDSYAENALRNALQDSYMAILLKDAVEKKTSVSSERQIWQN